MGSAALKLVVPTIESGTPVPPSNKGKRYADLREREYLRPEEVDQLIAAARRNKYGARDSLMILMAYRHGLRVGELCDLQWSQVDFKGWLHVNRLKHGMESNHPLKGDELRALRALKRENPNSTYVFIGEKGAPLSTMGFRKMLARLDTDLGFPIHPHMLRHACGYKLANDGRDTRSLQQYLGHKCIQHTLRYTQLNGERFKGWW